MDKRAKSLVSFLVCATLLVSATPFIASGFGVPAGSDASSWYMTVNGVLDTDKYTLYPYDAKSLKIGFSKFGEMVNSVENVGLEYGGARDPFASPAGSSVDSVNMPKRVWQEGWFINITYYSLLTDRIRNVWAMALHADLLDYGNGWIRVDDEYPGSASSESAENPRDRGYFIGSSPATYGFGGRKTNGTVTTGDIEVLYNGPRRFVARVVNTISDWVQLDGPETAIDVPLVQVIITIDFNKDTKEVNLFKDVKLITTKAVFGTIPISYFFPTEPTDEDHYELYSENPGFSGLFIQFSNRGEWDLGKPTEYRSYVHFFTQGAQTSPYDYVTSYTPKPQTAGPDENVSEGLATVYDYPYTLTTTIFSNYYSRHGPEPDTAWGDTFDMAQIIGYEGSGTAPKYVGYAAYWPSLSDWAVDGLGMSQWWKSLTTDDAHTIDRTSEPFKSPYLIGEWDFLLSDAPYTIDCPWTQNENTPIKVDKQFRGVTVYGLTDFHNDNILDDEDYEYEWCYYSTPYREQATVQSYDGEFLWEKKYFDPYKWDHDIVPYVGKGYDDNMNGFYADYYGNIIDKEVAYQLYQKFKPWDLEKSSEKWTSRWVEFGLGKASADEIDGKDLNEIIDGQRTDPVNVFKNGTTYDYIYLEMTNMLPFYSIAYHHDGVIGDDPEEVGEWSAYCTFAERVLVNGKLMVRGTDYYIVVDDHTENARVVFIDGGKPDKPLELDEKDVIKVLYSTWFGSYEWITVGKDSHPVDSIGSAMVTEAFDSIKKIPVWKPGLDMYESSTPTVPSLLRKFGAGDTRADYYYSATDHRLALKDDWSSTTPIASSNIITVGGPLANVVTEYFNEFGMVIYRGSNFGMNDFLLVPDWGSTFLGHDTLNTVVDPGELEGSGIGIVSTYKDLNGTVGLSVYGYSGEDTLWTSKLFMNLNTVPIFLDNGNGVLDWTDSNDNGLLDPGDLTWHDDKWVPKLHQTVHGWFAGDDLMLGWIIPDDEGNNKWFFMPLIMILQGENPGVTDLVIRLYYNIPNSCNPDVVATGKFFSQDVHPVALIVEELGRISEKPQHPDP